MKRTILCVIVLAAMFSVAKATPFQTIGMLRTPDAYVLPHKAAEILLVGYYRDVAAPAYYNTDEFGKFVPYGMLGVGLFDRVELGIFGGDSVYYLNLKLKVIQETNKIPQIAVGMDNIFSPVNRHRTQDHTPTTAPEWEFADHPDKHSYEYYSPYIVGSKQVVFGGINWMFNVGLGTNRFIGWVQRSRIWNGLFYSVELSPLKNLALQGEFSGHEFNAGVKYTYRNFGIKAGVEAMEDWVKDSDYKNNLRVAVGLSYLFDKYAEGKRVRPDLSEYAANVVTGDEVEIIDVADVATVTDGTITDGTTTDGTTTDGTTTDGTTVVVDGTTTDGTTTDGTTVVVDGTTTDGTTVVVTPPLVNPGTINQSTTYQAVSPEVKALLVDLRAMREQREKAQKALEDLRKWLEENSE